MHELLKIPDRSKLNKLSNSLEEWYFQIRFENESIDIYQNQKLGQGSTKNVYDVQINNQRFALALPNTNDDSEIIRTKWEKVLYEPENTDKLRDLGFLVNPICRIIPVEIDGVFFPAILMKRYQDLGFGLLDGRNNFSGTVKERILPQPVNREALIQFLSTAFPDITKLLDYKITLEPDSFNIALVEGQIRLYLNDLGKPRYPFDPIWNNSEVAQRYVRYFISAFINGLWWKEQEENEDFFVKILAKESTPGVSEQILKNIIK